MKKALLFVVMCAMISIFFVAMPAQAGNPDEIVIKYDEIGGHPVEFVLDKGRSQVILRIRLGKDDVRYDRYLNFLKFEVERFVGTGQLTEIGKTGNFFQFGSGYPIWGPFSVLFRDGDLRCLVFARNAYMVGSVIYASGESQVFGYYPYVLPHSPRR